MEEDLKELKIILKSVVISFPGKLTIRKLNRDYHKSEGRDIPYRDHGFESLELFLKSMPDTLKVIDMILFLPFSSNLMTMLPLLIISPKRLDI